MGSVLTVEILCAQKSVAVRCKQCTDVDTRWAVGSGQVVSVLGIDNRVVL